MRSRYVFTIGSFPIILIAIDIYTTLRYSHFIQIKINQTRRFAQTIDNFLKKRQLLQADFDDFKRYLSENPLMGDLIPGTNGVRKARLKSAAKGKSGGFRVCYYFISRDGEIFLLLVYPKNVQEDLTREDQKILKQMIMLIRGKNG